MLDEINKSSPKERGKRLRLLRKMSGLTLSEIASKYKLGVSTIKYWECAKSRGLSSKGAKKIIKAMHLEGIQCSYLWLMFGVGLPPQFIDVRFSSLKEVDMNVEQAVYEEEKSIDREVKSFCDNNLDVVTLSIFDDGMEPFYSIGDVVGGRQFSGVSIEKLVGKYCIVETVDHQLLCRKIAKGEGKNLYNLYCINPQTTTTPPNIYGVELLNASLITRIWKRVK